MNERHAKDFFGRSLYVGDEVATLLPRYRYTLVLAVVTKITPKMLRVRIEGVQGPGRMVEETTVSEAQVVKAPRS